MRNYQARNMMRDQMKLGDKVFFYHSNCKPPGIIGFAKVVKEGYPDHTALDPNSEHPDPKSTEENPRWYMVDIKYERKFKSLISLDDLKAEPALEGMQLLKRGNRLSVMPVRAEDWETILSLVE